MRPLADQETERRPRMLGRPFKATALVVVALVLFAIAFYGLQMAAECFFRANAPNRFRDRVECPIEDFERITGLPCPSDIQSVVSEDTHGGLHGDGRLVISLAVRPELIDLWLKSRPPWNARGWRNGPVPVEIGVNCTSGKQTLWTASDEEGRSTYQGTQEARCLLDAERIWYVAHDRGPSTMPWHNGNALILDPGTNRVWLFVWDY